MSALAEVKEMNSIDKVLKELDFPVEKQAAYLKNGRQIPGVAIVRSDTGMPLSHVGESYGLVKHSDSIRPFLESMVDSDFEIKKLIIERQGRRVMVELMSKETISIMRGDHVKLKLNFRNSFDRTSSLSCIFGAFRLKCSNGMGVFLDKFNMHIRQIHSKLLGDKLESKAFKEGLGQDILPKFRKAGRLLGGLTDRKVSDDDAKKLVEKFIGRKSVEEVMKLWVEGRGQTGDKTAWMLYNGASQYLTDTEMKATLPVSASYRTIQKTTSLLKALVERN